MLTAPLPLRERTLGDLLAAAGRARATGEVRLVRADGTSHVVALRDGLVTAARAAGVFDPLLARLHAGGTLDDEAFVALLEALGESTLRSGELARTRAGATRDAVDAALRDQAAARLRRIFADGDPRATARLVETAVRLDGVAVSLPWLSVVRGTPRARRATTPPPPRAPAARPTDASRRELRRLARALHPDLNGHLSPAERDALTARFARATAAYHALG